MPDAVTFGGRRVASVQISDTWGLTPGSASLVLEGESGEVSRGGEWAVSAGNFAFTGKVTSKSRESAGADGDQWKVTIADWRIALAKGFVAAAYNIEWKVGDKRRWRHLEPGDWESGLWTVTEAPKTGRQIVASILSGAEMEVQLGASYHGALDVPVFGLDWTGGTTPAAAISAVIDQCGAIVGMQGAKTLRFEKRGAGGLPAVGGPDQERWSVGMSESGDPTAAMVVGGANLYQYEEITLAADWNAKWEPYFDEFKFLEEVERSFMGDEPPAKDREGMAGVAIRAREVTVREWAAKKGGDFADRGRWLNGSRMDMPAWLYVREIVFKAYRLPDGLKVGGADAGLADLAGRLLCGVRQDTGGGGGLRFDKTDLYPEEKAIFFALGQPIDVVDPTMAEIFAENAERDWSSIWTRLDAEIDEEGKRFIFGEAVVIPGTGSKGLYIAANEEVPDASGDLKAIFLPNPDFEIKPAAVKASLCFAVGRYVKKIGSGKAIEVRPAPSLFREMLVPKSGSPEELPWPDGRTTDEMAKDYGGGLGDEELPVGSISRFGSAGTALSPAVRDRTASISPTGGITEQVNFAMGGGVSRQAPSRVAERQRSGGLAFGRAEAELRDELRRLRTLRQLLARGRGDRRGEGPGQGGRPAGPPLTVAVGATHHELVVFDPEKSGEAYKAGEIVFADEKNVAVEADGGGGAKLSGVVAAGNKASPMVRVADAGVVPVKISGPFSHGDPVGCDLGSRTARVGGSVFLGTVASATGYSGTSPECFAMVKLGAGSPAKSRVPAITPVRQAPAWWRKDQETVPDGGLVIYFTLGVLNGYFADNYDSQHTISEDTYFYADVKLNGGGPETPLAVQSWRIATASEARAGGDREGYSASGDRPQNYWIYLGAAFKHPDTGAWTVEPAISEGDGNIEVQEYVSSWARDGSTGGADVVRALTYVRGKIA